MFFKVLQISNEIAFLNYFIFFKYNSLKVLFVRLLFFKLKAYISAFTTKRYNGDNNEMEGYRCQIKNILYTNAQQRTYRGQWLKISHI